MALRSFRSSEEFWRTSNIQLALDCASDTANAPVSNLTTHVITSLASPSVTLDLASVRLFGLTSSKEAQFRLGPLARGAGVNMDRKGLFGGVDEGPRGKSRRQEAPQEYEAEDDPSDG